MKHITIISPCFNEEGNVRELHQRISAAMEPFAAKYTFNLLFIDNASSDKTVAIIRELAAQDPRVQAIVNARNFGHIRSPHHALLQADGDAVIAMASDLQDPPELLPEFIKNWEDGFKVVVGVKSKSEESFLFYSLRSAYYRLLRRLSTTELLEHFTGFGLYDKRVIQVLRQLDDPYPYFRGLIADIGFRSAKIPFLQPLRRRGITKNNFYTLFDMAMLGFTNHSKVPLRMSIFVGFITALVSSLSGLFYLAYKLINWNSFELGMAPMVIGMFLFSSVQLVFLGVVGEYVGAIHTQVLKRPLVVEAERINFAEAQSPTVAPPLAAPSPFNAPASPTSVAASNQSVT